MRRITRFGPVVGAVVVAVAVAACGGGTGPDGGNLGAITASGTKTIDIYSSLPMRGVEGAQMIPLANGIKLALSQAHGMAGQFKVDYIPLDDSTAAAGGWDTRLTAANARKAATDPRAVAYIGEFDSAASEVSAPILNAAGLAQVSPANTYVGLTQNVPGASASGEPQRYFPSGKRTYVRIAPADTVQAGADLMALGQAGCTKLAIANDKSAYGAGIAAMVAKQAPFYGMTITSNTAINPKASNFRSYAQGIKSQGAQCFEFAGLAADGGVQIAKDVNAALPDATILGPDRMCTGAWTNPKLGGVPASVDSKLLCTLPTLPLKAYPGGRSFLAAYRKVHGKTNPDPYAIYGYEAMKLVLDTIASQGPNGNSRADIVKALFAIRNRHSVLGTYGFNANGDTTLTSYGLYKVGSHGDPVYDKTLTPAQYPPGA